VSQCQNCQSPIDGAYCPTCGQKDVDFERPIWGLFGEIVRETLDIDGRAYRTIRTLMLKPGVLTREYLAGRRRSYTPPLRLYLVISVSFFVLVSWLVSRGVLLDTGQTLEKDAASQARFMSDDLPRLMFVLMPVFALMVKIVFPSRLYFDHLIFSVHLHSAVYVLLAFTIPLEKIAGEHWVPLVAQVLLLCYLLAYIVISVHRVFGTNWLASSLKSMAILLGYMMIVAGVIEATSSLQLLSD
jgi:hypothetical protein